MGAYGDWEERSLMGQVNILKKNLDICYEKSYGNKGLDKSNETHSQSDSFDRDQFEKDCKEYKTKYNTKYLLNGSYRTYGSDDKIIQRVKNLNLPIKNYKDNIEDFLAPFRAASMAADLLDLSFLDPLRDAVDALNGVLSVIPDWLTDIIEWFSCILPFDEIIEMFLDEIPIPSIPMDGVLSQFDDVFGPIGHIDFIDATIDTYLPIVNYAKNYNLPFPYTKNQDPRYSSYSTDTRTFYIDSYRYRCLNYTGVGAQYTDSSGYCSHNSCTGKAWCTYVSGE